MFFLSHLDEYLDQDESDNFLILHIHVFHVALVYLIHFADELLTLMKIVESWFEFYSWRDVNERDWVQIQVVIDVTDHLGWVPEWSCKKHVLLRWKVYD